MLIITGTIGDKEFKDENISAAKLAGLMSIPLPKKEVKELTLPKEKKKKDAFGQPAFASGLNIPALFSATTKDGTISITLRYATSSRGDGDKKVYTPHKYELFSGSHTRQFAAQDSEEYVYAFLHPKNADSPFYDGGEAAYESYDPELFAQGQMDIMKLVQAYGQKIFALTEQSAKVIVSGIIVNGKTYPQGPNVSGTEAKMQLIQLLNESPVAFKNAWESLSTTIRGYVNVAIAGGHLVSRTKGSDSLSWSIDSRQIATFRNSEDQVVALTDFFDRNAELFDLVKGKVGIIELNSVAEEEQMKPVEAMTGEDIVSVLMEKNLLAPDFSTKSVLLITEDTKKGELITKFTNFAEWRQQAATAIDINKELRESLIKYM